MTAISPGCAAALEAAAAFDLTGHTLIEVAGQDRAKFLHNFCTNDVTGLAAGQGCEAFFCNAKGRVLAHATLFCDADSIWIETIAGASSALMAHLDRYIIREDVVLHDRTAEFGELCIVGPTAVAVLAQLSGGDATTTQQRLEEQDAPGTVLELPATFGSCAVRAVHWLGRRSFLLIGPRDTIAEWQRRLSESGVVTGTAADWESLRIDAGWPEYGREITDGNLPQEVARNDAAISFRKGCYLGQEPVARLDALGHTNRELRRLQLECPQPVPGGTELVGRDGDQGVGQLTSAAVAPSGTGCVGLGYLKTKWSAPGTTVAVVGSEERIPVTVRPLSGVD